MKVEGGDGNDGKSKPYGKRVVVEKEEVRWAK
jgi:hypothetical protein